MTVKQMRAFLAVAQSLSFAVACERLHLSQSALSLTIKALEEGLGGRLFSRTTRNVALWARELRLSSSAVGLMAPPPIMRATGTRPQVQIGALGGQMQGFCIVRNTRFTMRSSME